MEFPLGHNGISGFSGASGHSGLRIRSHCSSGIGNNWIWSLAWKLHVLWGGQKKNSYNSKNTVTLMYMEWLTNGDLLYSTENSTQYYVIICLRKVSERDCVYMYNWITLLYNRNYHIVYQLHFNKTLKNKKNHTKNTNIWLTSMTWDLLNKGKVIENTSGEFLSWHSGNDTTRNHEVAGLILGLT